MAPPKMVSAIGLEAVELKLTVGLRAHFTYPTDDLLLIYYLFQQHDMVVCTL